jgi:plastocyanin
MLRRIFVPLVILALALAAAAVGNARTTAAHKLIGEVGPSYKIEVTTTADKDVKTTKAGKYTIHIEDKSTAHNFHLMGPGVNKKTAVGFKGDTNWTVTLKPGKYTYQCDPHASFGMKGSFRVTR